MDIKKHEEQMSNLYKDIDSSVDSLGKSARSLAQRMVAMQEELATQPDGAELFEKQSQELIDGFLKSPEVTIFGQTVSPIEETMIRNLRQLLLKLIGYRKEAVQGTEKLEAKLGANKTSLLTPEDLEGIDGWEDIFADID